MGQKDKVAKTISWVSSEDMMKNVVRNQILGLWVAEELGISGGEAMKLAADFVEAGSIARNDEDMAEIALAELEFHPAHRPLHHFTARQLRSLLDQLSVISNHRESYDLVQENRHHSIHDALHYVMENVQEAGKAKA